jgi:ubiquinol oxidase
VSLERALNAGIVSAVVALIDGFYEKESPYARFYALETVARCPYFAFTSVLHLYETLGWWRRSEYLKVHFAESWNELHHLMIMEALGGNERWADRFVAQHAAVGLYWATCAIYLLSPRMAYHLMELVEEHAFESYDKFLTSHGEQLKTLPAPAVAVAYYTGSDKYLLDEFQVGVPPGSRRFPQMATLHDVFTAIRDDEGVPCHTMRLCQTAGAVVSPHAEGGGAEAGCEGLVECVLEQPTGIKAAR